MKITILSLVISIVFGNMVFGSDMLRKSVAVKTFANNHYIAKDTSMISGQQSTSDSVTNLLSSLKNPLILANGIKISVHILANMNVEDIQDFSIYKGADALKLYGSRGAEGVIDIRSSLSKRELRKKVKKYNRERRLK